MAEAEACVVGGAGVDLEVHLRCPPAAVAAVVLLHGWGDAASTMAPLADLLASVGIATAAVSLRGFGGSGGVDDCGLRQPDDVVLVARWLGARSGLPVGLLGISQGGQVALLAAARGAPVFAVAAWSAVTDVARWRATTGQDGVAAYLDRTCADGDLGARSPVAHVDRLAVPVLLVHGDADVRVPTGQSVLLHEQLAGRSRSCELLLLPGVGHQRGRAGNRQAFEASAAFFLAHLPPSATGAVWLSPRAACVALGISLRVLYRLVDEGELRCHQLGPTHRFRASDVDACR